MFTLKSLPEFDVWLAGLRDPLVRSAVMKRLKREQSRDIAQAKALVADIASTH